VTTDEEITMPAYDGTSDLRYAEAASAPQVDRED
jgi:hypothetical protein